MEHPSSSTAAASSVARSTSMEVDDELLANRLGADLAEIDAAQEAADHALALEMAESMELEAAARDSEHMHARAAARPPAGPPPVNSAAPPRPPKPSAGPTTISVDNTTVENLHAARVAANDVGNTIASKAKSVFGSIAAAFGSVASNVANELSMDSEDSEDSDEAPRRGPNAERVRRAVRRLRIANTLAKKESEMARVFDVMEAIIPEQCDQFVVKLPDGDARLVELADVAPLGPGDVLHVPYDGAVMLEEIDKSTWEPPTSEARGEAFLSYYRFDPYEVESAVPVLMGARALGGCELAERDEGVFVAWAVVPLPRRADGASPPREFRPADGLRAGDLLVTVDGQPIESLAALKAHLATRRLGSLVAVRALRRPPPVVKCPALHELVKEWSERVVSAVPCARCQLQWGRWRCIICENYELCTACHATVFALSKSKAPVPVNLPIPERCVVAPPSVKFSCSAADANLRVLVFRSVEWWLGRVASYERGRGHVVVLMDTTTKRQIEYVIQDPTLVEYRVLLSSEAPPALESAAPPAELQRAPSFDVDAPLLDEASEPQLLPSLQATESFGVDASVSTPVMDEPLVSEELPSGEEPPAEEEPPLTSSAPSEDPEASVDNSQAPAPLLDSESAESATVAGFENNNAQQEGGNEEPAPADDVLELSPEEAELLESVKSNLE